MKSAGNFSGARNKTLIGINNAEIYGGTGLVGCKNIIVKNIKFCGGPNDSFGLSGCLGIWLDHIEAVDGSDANCDIVNGTDLVTVSWSKFYYTRGHGHMLSNLVGNRQPLKADEGKERVTFHHNWWGAGVKSRAPRVRYGQVHIFNNFYGYEKVPGDSGSNYAVGGGYKSKLLVENNYFENISKAFTWMGDKDTAEVAASGNVLVKSGGEFTNRGESFKPPYDYTLESAEEAKKAVMKYAGVR
jgi:pectate lyase